MTGKLKSEERVDLVWYFR